MLEVKNLYFSYGTQANLTDINFSVKKGAISALIGANGSGKSTLLKCCMNFLKPKSGEVYIDGEPSLDKPPYWMAKKVAYVPQASSPVFAFSVFESVIMGRSIFMNGRFKFKKSDEEAAIRAMEIVGIIDLKDRIMTNLSGGQRQLVLIARSIAQDANLMIFDEPTAALDFNNQILFWQIIKKISKSDKSILVCTHEPNHALWFCSEFIALKNGKLIKKGEISSKFDEELFLEIYNRKAHIRSIGNLQLILPKIDS